MSYYTDNRNSRSRNNSGGIQDLFYIGLLLVALYFIAAAFFAAECSKPPDFLNFGYVWVDETFFNSDCKTTPEGAKVYASEEDSSDGSSANAEEEAEGAGMPPPADYDVIMDMRSEDGGFSFKKIPVWPGLKVAFSNPGWAKENLQDPHVRLTTANELLDGMIWLIEQQVKVMPGADGEEAVWAITLIEPIKGQKYCQWSEAFNQSLAKAVETGVFTVPSEMEAGQIETSCDPPEVTMPNPPTSGEVSLLPSSAPNGPTPTPNIVTPTPTVTPLPTFTPAPTYAIPTVTAQPMTLKIYTNPFGAISWLATNNPQGNRVLVNVFDGCSFFDDYVKNMSAVPFFIEGNIDSALTIDMSQYAQQFNGSCNQLEIKTGTSNKWLTINGSHFVGFTIPSQPVPTATIGAPLPTPTAAPTKWMSWTHLEPSSIVLSSWIGDFSVAANYACNLSGEVVDYSQVHMINQGQGYLVNLSEYQGYLNGSCEGIRLTENAYSVDGTYMRFGAAQNAQTTWVIVGFYNPFGG